MGCIAEFLKLTHWDVLKNTLSLLVGINQRNPISRKFGFFYFRLPPQPKGRFDKKKVGKREFSLSQKFFFLTFPNTPLRFHFYFFSLPGIFFHPLDIINKKRFWLTEIIFIFSLIHPNLRINPPIASVDSRKT